MALPDKYRLLSPFFVEREIAGSMFKFYPNSVRVAARLGDTIADLSAHISVLLSNTQRDQGSVHEEVKDAEGMTVTKTSVQPINPDLAKLRVEKRATAVKKATEKLTSPQNRMILAELLMDSLRDDYDRGKNRTSEDLQELVDGMEIPVLMEFLAGLVAANAKVFGDLGKTLKDALGEQLGGALGGLLAQAPQEVAG